MFDELEAALTRITLQISWTLIRIFWRPALVGFLIYYAVTQFLYLTLAAAVLVLTVLAIRWYLSSTKDPS